VESSVQRSSFGTKDVYCSENRDGIGVLYDRLPGTPFRSANISMPRSYIVNAIPLRTSTLDIVNPVYAMRSPSNEETENVIHIHSLLTCHACLNDFSLVGVLLNGVVLLHTFCSGREQLLLLHLSGLERLRTQ
jgi:hypothetical protein